MKTLRMTSQHAWYALPLLIAVSAEAVLAQPGASLHGNETKIEPQLSRLMQTNGNTSFFIRFNQQADFNTNNAPVMDWRERGRFVQEKLKHTAANSQGGARRILDTAGVNYRTFLVDNTIYVPQADLATLEALAALPEVQAITEPRTFYIGPPIIDEASAPAANGALAWGISDTHADVFWTTFSKQGEGIIVANIDTGVQWNHPALDQAFKCGNTPTNPACWYDPSNICGAAGACDNNGHGTHTMGTMVGDDDATLAYRVGMAPAAQWIACKGCESNSCSEFALNACADWILAPGGDTDNRPHVVNNSWGGDSGDSWYQAKVNAWRAAGIFPAFSAGNSGSDCNTLGSPGDYQASFASAAHDASGTIASFSSRGPSPAFGDTPYTKPNISAPGVNICSALPSNNWSCGYSGTSMASPHTAGAVALLWSCNPDLRGQVDQTFQILQGDADAPPTGNCGAPSDNDGNYTYGYGYLNVLAAGQASCSSSPPPPSLAIADASITEGNSGSKALVLTLSRSGSTADTISVDYATADGSATVADGDYTPISDTLDFPVGVTSQTISVPVLGDTKSESNEFFFVNLSNPSAGASIVDGQAKGTIINDDAQLPGLGISDVSKSEGNRGYTSFTFTLRLTARNPTGVTLDYATQNGTALAGSDYLAANGTLTFSGTQTSHTITVKVIGDRVKEADETFTLKLTNAQGAVINDDQGLGTLRNDDR
jgi:hypothetical protein